ncbi:ATPase family AAA domain-containing protein At1g05910 isoform X2 [Lactuca sativa]|uniref:ATPase family AAA domain-containing protein At1g05910 isoform X2 n=1 Tax=Lactuca sativa TaxID=4236 RepID=UPI001C6930BD|nr:ATPase family AAA domain-containing protein At1g05910 isoform X2 [Lactuca sativa]
MSGKSFTKFHEDLGPSILHELENFPVHALGLSSLLSDLSAKTPKEALVLVFCESRRTIPSILYLPEFHLLWENAHDQLRVVLLTLLAELPSDSPILILGTSFVQLNDAKEYKPVVLPSISEDGTFYMWETNTWTSELWSSTSGFVTLDQIYFSM